MIRILFLCTGNICRSPLADGFARHRIKTLGLDWSIDSAGTGDWHVGETPDPRAMAVAAQRGYSIGDLRARQLEPSDYFDFNHIVALDRSHLEFLTRHQPAGATSKNTLLLDWASMDHDSVADPYYDDDTAFALVADEIETGVNALIDALAERPDMI